MSSVIPPTEKPFTGRARRRTTRWTVALNDRFARVVIAVGGIGTIIAVSLVCVFLVWVVVPLFLPVEVSPPASLAATADASQLLALGADEYKLTGWAISKQGHIRVFRLDSGETIETIEAGQASLTDVACASIGLTNSSTAFGFGDGRVRLGEIAFDYQIVPPGEVPEEHRKLRAGELAVLGEGAVLVRTDHGEFRRQKFRLQLDEPLEIAPGSAITRIDHVALSSGTRICSVSADGKLRVHQFSRSVDEFSGETQTELQGGELPLDNARDRPPDYALISELGDMVFAAWRDGRLVRFGTRNVEKPRRMEETDLVEEPGHALTALSFMLGRTTLIAGDTLGRLRAWFTAELDETGIEADEGLPFDERTLVAAHEFPATGCAVTALAPSPRSRLLAAGFADGQVRLLYVAANRTLAQLHAGGTSPVDALTIAPKGNALLAATKSGITRWDFDAQHPDATLATLFLPVWYEGYRQPAHQWQSTGSSDASESKLGLIPLVFGTLKATFYTMLFGAPLALLAAIYSSEFLNPRLKARIKPTIEMMASLPSVVLGFLAGLVVAPYVEHVVPELLTCLFTIPLAVLCGAYLWQLAPSAVAVRSSRYRLALIMLMMPLGAVVGIKLGPLVEQWLFAGDIKAWLDRQRGSGIGGWMLLLLPLSSMFVAVIFTQQVNPWLRRHSAGWTRTQAGLIDLVKFVAGVACVLGLALLIASALDALRLDPRGTLMGTYVQRNALVVGFAMGFAIIPLIYTIADDALSTVPEHLRSASLGAGATPWQTAMRIVVPTAASGLFSALMIGLGRAVGETMIVLMAAGNTPVMNWNIFEGFETLSMAIATELPEAAKNSTHYRTLFLAALTLFVITFIVNTVAEVVRQRFRRRAYEL